MTVEVRNALRTSAAESPKPELAPIGGRLAEVRADSGLSQKGFARDLGVPDKTYSRWERGVREISAEGLSTLAARGWNLNWLLTGEGLSRMIRDSYVREAGVKMNAEMAVASHHVSDEWLTIALELADKVLGDRWLPKPIYAHLTGLMYERLAGGDSYEKILRYGLTIAEDLFGGTTGAGTSGVDSPGAGRTGAIDPKRSGPGARPGKTKAG